MYLYQGDATADGQVDETSQEQVKTSPLYCNSTTTNHCSISQETNVKRQNTGLTGISVHLKLVSHWWITQFITTTISPQG